MRRLKWLLLVAVGVLSAALHGHAGPEAGPEDLERARRRLEQMRADPERYRRLQDDYRKFRALPRERRERLRALDRQLHETDPATQNRLLAALGRYRLWLDGLGQADLRRVALADTPAERLRVIQDIRERQWVDRLPAAARKELAKLSGEQRKARVAVLRKEERELRERWQLRPARLKQFPPEVQRYVLVVLRPRLTRDEARQLNEADGRWPLLAATILDLSEKHPTLTPPRVPYRIVRRFDDLPEGAQKPLMKALKMWGAWDEVQKHQGKWPDYAQALADAVKKNKRLRLLPWLGPSAP